MQDEFFAESYNLIYVESQGDYITNMDQVVEQMHASDSTKPILLHFMAESPSIIESGLDQHVKNFKFQTKDDQQIYIHTPNLVEKVDYENLSKCPVSHHLINCRRYWVDEVVHPSLEVSYLNILRTQYSSAWRFGHFIGRATTPRMKFFYDLNKYKIGHLCFQSKLLDQTAGDKRPPGYWAEDTHIWDRCSLWFDTLDEQESFIDWYNNHNLPSFDNLGTKDINDPDKTGRLNIVRDGWKYHIDIVFETFTVGDVFCPTEKIIRSLIAEKPFLVYAAPNFLKQLKELGFRTFGTLWDESYDAHKLRSRYDQILTQVKHLATMPQAEFETLMLQTREITAHNKQVLKQINIDIHGSEENWINSPDNTYS